MGLDSAHNQDLHPEDLDLVVPSSSKDQREGLRRDHNLVREWGDHRVDQEDKGLWVAPHRVPHLADLDSVHNKDRHPEGRRRVDPEGMDLWTDHHPQDDLVDRPREARAQLNNQNEPLITWLVTYNPSSLQESEKWFPQE